MKSHLDRLFPNPFRRHAIAAAAFALCSGYALAVEPFTVKDIRVEGVQRTEAGTVFSYLPVRVGETFNDEKGAAAIRALYATGFFKDVRIEAEGSVLVVFVEERPAVATIEFTGIKEFEKEMLIKALKDIGLAEARIFDKALVDRAEQELKRQYLSRSLYNAQVTTTVTPLERNRVSVNFTVDEGEPARIRKISFVGNKAFTDSQLRGQFSLTTPGWLTWLSKSDQYSRQKLTADIESLKSYYQQNEAIAKLVQLKKGDVYSGEKMTASAKKISDYLGNFGYAFANVNPNPVIDREKKEVAFTIFIDPGRRVYVRQMNVAGNNKTRDEVIRREFRQMEGSWYNGENIKLSRDRVDRLGYFKEVSVQTPEVPGVPDQVDVNMTVAEKPTGNLLVGVGFSQSEKLMLQSSIQQDNFAGTGNTVGLTANTSSRYRTIALSQTNPYFTDDGVSRSYEIFMRTTRPPLINSADYRVRTMGANVKFGVPFTEVDRVFLGVGVENTKVETFSNSPERYEKFVTDLGGTNPGSASANSLPLTVAWQRDSRDSALVPTKGRYQRANLEFSLLGDLKYYKATYQHQYYWPLSRTVTLALNGQVDYGRGLGGKPYPVFKNVYAGGIGTVRGYESSSIGGLDANEDAIGGSKRVFANVELQLPFSNDNKDRTLRWFTFFDAGTVWDEHAKMSLGDLRYSTGFGISWVSPIGPLKLSYGIPLNAKPEDRKQQIQFQLGTGF
ncbi:MAG: bamA [Burkholderiaceae bacterium]|nr:bamA [Burkholderiaceae bacterium]